MSKMGKIETKTDQGVPGGGGTMQGSGQVTAYWTWGFHLR